MMIDQNYLTFVLFWAITVRPARADVHQMPHGVVFGKAAAFLQEYLVLAIMIAHLVVKEESPHH